MKPWTVVEKTEKYIDKDSVELHLKVERGGAERDVIVSGATYYSVAVGGTVDLPLHSGTSEDKVHTLADALYRVLVRTGSVRNDRVSIADLIVAAEAYAASPKVPEPTLIKQVVELGATLGTATTTELATLREQVAKLDQESARDVAIDMLDALIVR